MMTVVLPMDSKESNLSIHGQNVYLLQVVSVVIGMQNALLPAFGFQPLFSCDRFPFSAQKLDFLCFDFFYDCDL